METLDKLKEALDKQNEAGKDFKLAVENMKEEYVQYEEAYCNVLVILTDLIKDFDNLVSK